MKKAPGNDLGDLDNHASTKTFHWFFTDIVGSSDPNITTEDQIEKITALIDSVKNTATFKSTTPDERYVLPTGDGMAIGFRDSPEKPIQLAIETHKLLSAFNKNRRGPRRVDLRIGIDIGPIYFIKDLEDKDNIWGPGIIMARRVMDLCGPNNIFASERIATDLHNLSKTHRATIRPIGEYEIKHGDKLRIYNIYGNGFGNKNFAKKNKNPQENQYY